MPGNTLGYSKAQVTYDTTKGGSGPRDRGNSRDSRWRGTRLSRSMGDAAQVHVGSGVYTQGEETCLLCSLWCSLPRTVSGGIGKV